MAPGIDVVIPDEDPERTYTLEELVLLTQNLEALLEGVHRGAFSHLPISPALISALHRNLFNRVRGHAGRFRSTDAGTERLTFGPHRSCHRSEVAPLLEHVCESAMLELRRLEGDRGAEDYEPRALELAVRLHADVIWIHPFEDGNGRSSRALMSYALVRLGLRPISIDAPKQEYIDALNRFFTTGDITPLMDLTLGLYQAGDETR